MLRSALVVCALVGACPSPLHAAPAPGDEVARIAARFLDEKPRLRRADCSGLVNDVLREAGVDARGGTRHHWDLALREGRVARGPILPGDLVFFDRTYDANKNGRVDDALTHIAVALRTEDDGTVVMVHRATTGIEELRMNLATPRVHVKPHRPGEERVVVNSPLRTPRYGKKAGPRLTGELYRGHARPIAPLSPGVDVDAAPRARTSAAGDAAAAPPPDVARIAATDVREREAELLFCRASPLALRR